jgi:protoporphyrinogen IX oxidase
MYDIIKSLHIIFVVSWFSGLFYMPRLFIYHTEAQEKDELSKKALSDQFQIMEKKLWWIITTPAMILTFLFGFWMLWLNPYLLQQPWMHIKLAFILVLLVYHFISQKLMFKMAKGMFTWNSNQLRMWNELATLCLVAIIFLVETQGRLSWWKATLSFFLVALGLMLLIKLYKRLRKG